MSDWEYKIPNDPDSPDYEIPDRQPAPDPVCPKCDGTGKYLGWVNGGFAQEWKPCPDCQPAPASDLVHRGPTPSTELEPEQRWEWRKNELFFGDRIVPRIDLTELLNAHGITPDSKPIDKERGRGLVRQCTGLVADYDTLLRIVREMRDWISDLVKEPQ